MPELTVPGLYVEELPAGPHGITGVSTSTVAFIGMTTKGPLNRPTVVADFSAYGTTFGAASGTSPLALAVRQFFDNGGRRAVVVRTKASRRGGELAASANQIIGDSKTQTGLHALDPSEPIGLLLTPDVATMAARDANAVARAVLKFCETRRVFHILELPGALARHDKVSEAVDWAARHGFLHHANAAAYFPNLVMSDPAKQGATLSASPSGAVAGVYARTDSDRGVWQAPAGARAELRNVVDLTCDVSGRAMDQLTKVSINPIMKRADLGILVWGARTFQDAQQESEWRYVPVRRTALFIKESLYRGLQWTVFEPNGDALWAQIRLVVSSFMNQLFRSGAFQGATPRDAYFVSCGRDTMTETDIDRGRIVIEIGFAPVKPAEFVILRVQLPTANGGSPP